MRIALRRSPLVPLAFAAILAGCHRLPRLADRATPAEPPPTEAAGAQPVLSLDAPPPFVCGRRATARVTLGELGLDYVAAAPAEGFRSVRLLAPGLTTTSVRLFPNHVVRLAAEPTHGEARITVFAAREAPYVVLLIDRYRATRTKPAFLLPLDVTLNFSPHVGFIRQFMPQGRCRVRWTRNACVLQARERPDLAAVIRTSAPLVPLGPRRGEVEDGGCFSARLRLEGAHGFVVLGAGKRATLEAGLRRLTDATLRVELEAVEAAEARALADGAQLETPDADLNRFFRESRIWFDKDVRRLPFGAPYASSGVQNAEVDVLTASPDYHGVFANDCVQTALEGMIVAPRLRPIYERDLEVLYGFAMSGQHPEPIPESVELMSGTDGLALSDLRIGQHPEWIVSLASMVLLSGDRALGERLWPGVEYAAQYFVDRNGDGVGEWDTAAYPEQPSTAGYQSGMLYAQAWWVWAFDRAAELAQFLGKPRESATFRARRDAAQSAMERVFGRADGYGVWLSPQRKTHPHEGHEMIIPVALGLSSPDGAARVLATVQSPRMWLEPFGPLRANRGSGIADGDAVWGFMRWNYVQALFAAGQADAAARQASAWARQELALGLPAPESFPRPVTGFTGSGYVWEAGRALRAVALGLFGLRPLAAGIEVRPHLPRAWPSMTLTNLPFRGRTLTIDVRRGLAAEASLNGRPWTGPVVREADLPPGASRLAIVVAG